LTNWDGLILIKLPNIKEILRNILFRIVKLLGILDLKPVVFMHLQKTAGTTIVNIARHFYGNEETVSHSDVFMDTNGVHLADKQFLEPDYVQNRFNEKQFISGHFGYSFAKQFMDGRYSFTFLRNPVDRLLSFYYFCLTRNPKQFSTYALAQRLSLDDFLTLGFTDPVVKSHIWNYQVCQLADGFGTSNDLMPKDEKLLELAIQHLDEFSYIGFTETFKQDQDRILKEIGITIPVGNPFYNVNLGHPVFEDLPQSSKTLLLALTELDRALYDTAWKRKKVREDQMTTGKH
jgi:Sulfotransferase family